MNILLGRLRYRWQGDITEDIRELGSEYVKQNKPVGSKRNNNQATSTSLQTRAAEILNAFRSVLQFSDPGWNILVYIYISENFNMYCTVNCNFLVCSLYDRIG